MKESDAVPFYFGPEHQRLFGWLHPAAEESGTAMGLVLCNPFGSEALSAHRTYRHIARSAAAAGFPALRFDYHGTGDSAGDDADPERVASWLRSIADAVKALRDHSQVDRVCLFGLRLGALLAAIAAPAIPEVCALALVAPVASGRSFMRELRALAATHAAAGDSVGQNHGNVFEVAGFLITSETAAALEALHVSAVQRGTVTDALLIERGDMPATPRFANELASHGIAVARESLADYAGMMLDPHEAQVPAGLTGLITNWLRSCDCSPAASPSKIPATRTSSRALPQQATVNAADGLAGVVHESAIAIPAHGTNLHGVLCQPVNCHARSSLGGARVVLLLSAGATHRIGPGRLYTTISRALAAQGLAVLRLDIAGIGDSPPRADAEENVVYPEGAVDDAVSAASFAANLPGAGPLLMAGICSGSYHSLRAATNGASLEGIFVINPLTYSWRPGMSLAEPEYRLVAEAQRQRRNALQMRSWIKLARGEVNIYSSARMVTQRLGTQIAYRLRDFMRMVHWPMKDDLAAELIAIVNRGTRMHFIFSDGDPGLTMLQEQAGRTVGRLQRRGRLQIDIIHDADHTFTPLAARRELIATLCRQLAALDPAQRAAMP